MSVIRVLDNQTIDQIAAGEVVERPASIVKELVENAMDSGADAITVEIKGGGIDVIRVTDNGSGIAADDIPTAFLRHATSKIRSITDLESLHSMGFRGEALASIASVSKVTMITKCPDELMGHKYCINGGVPEELEEIGAPNGTTIISAHLFYNTPVRRKFLKSATGEANVISELMEHLALSRPDISYKYIVNGTTRFMTTGSGDLKEVIYRIFGKDTAHEMVPVSYDVEGIRIDGYLGSPVLNRPNRNFENYFLNQRYIRSDVVARGIEEGYSGYTMQHKFPFCVLHITMDSSEVDVNVHPSKMDVRFHDRQGCFDHISKAVSDTLHGREMIPETVLEKQKEKKEKLLAPEPFEDKRRTEMVQTVNESARSLVEEKSEETVGINDKAESVLPKTTPPAEDENLEKHKEISNSEDTREEKSESGIAVNKSAEPVYEPVTKENRDIFDISFDDDNDDAKVVDFRANKNASITKESKAETVSSVPDDTKNTAEDIKSDADDTEADRKQPGNEKKMQYIPKQQVFPNRIPADPYQNAQQMELLPKERVISEKARKQYRLIGSIFNTYWMFSYQEKLYFVDQHAAHEKVNYEKLVRQYKAHQVYTQQLNPPIIVSLSPSETETLEAYQEHFAELGFTIESFGGTEYAISTIPLDLYRKEPKTLFMEILNELSLKGVRSTPNIIDRVLATMACKAS
ncbi:MAG: DNA mismatch repair endonuclease MutL, partial [Lachnospiraceae bacterium]|nr:DNA mismatch repair endonuclease MutL [Lachnospiraceae bacterium]